MPVVKRTLLILVFLASWARLARSDSFSLTSPAVANGETLPREFTGFGDSATLPLEWTGAPAATKSYALIMDHHPGPNDTKWYWILYNIPADVHALPKNVKGIGTLGNNSVNGHTEYAPPHSKGAGEKTYTYTVYALSAPPQVTVAPEQVNRDVLLAAMKDRILGSAELSVVFSRPADAGVDQPGERRRDDRPPQADQNRGKNPPQRPGTFPNAGSPTGEQKAGLFINKKEACQGYTLFPPKCHTTFLIDMDGRVVHTWTSEYLPEQSAYLLENGLLLRPANFIGRAGGRIELLDWESNVVWGFNFSGDTFTPHHDVCPLPNGNVLVLSSDSKTREQAIAMGRDPATLNDRGLLSEMVSEVKPTGKTTGEVVWEWKLWDHIIQSFDKSKPNYGVVCQHPERLDVNAGRGGDWLHANAISYNAERDEILINSRAMNEFYVLDHSTSKAEAASHAGGKKGKGGDILYRWGNPANYGAGTSTDQMLHGQHDAHWIQRGLKGAGDILAFDNFAGTNPNYSAVVEIAPPLDAAGEYVRPAAGKPFGPAKVTWQYTAPNKTDLYADKVSGAQRLPNGNTLICAGSAGLFIEINPNNDIVWKYVNAVGNGGKVVSLNVEPGAFGTVFRCTRILSDYPGIKGRILTPKGTVQELYPDKLITTAQELKVAGPGGGPGAGGGDAPPGGAGQRAKHPPPNDRPQ